MKKKEVYIIIESVSNVIWFVQSIRICLIWHHYHYCIGATLHSTVLLNTDTITFFFLFSRDHFLRHIFAPSRPNECVCVFRSAISGRIEFELEQPFPIKQLPVLVPFAPFDFNASQCRYATERGTQSSERVYVYVLITSITLFTAMKINSNKNINLPFGFDFQTNYESVPRINVCISKRILTVTLNQIGIVFSCSDFDRFINDCFSFAYTCFLSKHLINLWLFSVGEFVSCTWERLILLESKNTQ